MRISMQFMKQASDCIAATLLGSVRRRFMQRFQVCDLIGWRVLTRKRLHRGQALKS
ncbi:hypothetical protein X732_30750 [Mesorhizobium sp. L2C066B000]|nr:hypothetical protein X732_30750 [Mesorhizobium sp. L2C066B000]